MSKFYYEDDTNSLNTVNLEDINSFARFTISLIDESPVVVFNYVQEPFVNFDKGSIDYSGILTNYFLKNPTDRQVKLFEKIRSVWDLFSLFDTTIKLLNLEDLMREQGSCRAPIGDFYNDNLLKYHNLIERSDDIKKKHEKQKN